MKILRPAVVMLTMTASFAFSASSDAAEAEAMHAAPVAAQNPMSLTQTYDQLRTDLAKAEFTGETMLGRIDSFVTDVDVAIQSKPAEAGDLTKLREGALKMRSEVVRFMDTNGTQLVQINMPAGDFLGGPMTSGPVMNSGPIMSGGSFSGGAISGGGGGIVGGGAAAGGGGLGIGALGLIGAAVAIPVAVASDDDDDVAGAIASPSS